MGGGCGQHPALRSRGLVVPRAHARVLKWVLLPRPRCLPLEPLPVSCLIGFFAPRRLSLPSNPDGTWPRGSPAALSRVLSS